MPHGNRMSHPNYDLPEDAKMDQRSGLSSPSSCNVLQEVLGAADERCDMLSDNISVLESRLNALLHPSYFGAMECAEKTQTEPHNSSPLVGELARHNARLNSLRDRLTMLLEHLEV